MTRKGEREIVKVEKPSGGEGYILKEALLGAEELGAHCKMFSKVTLPPHSELGHHEHHGETETYYILSGEGIYEDNGTKIPAKPGDVFFCKDGDGHGIRNDGEEDVGFAALILKK